MKEEIISGYSWHGDIGIGCFFEEVMTVLAPEIEDRMSAEVMTSVETNAFNRSGQVHRLSNAAMEQTLHFLPSPQ